MGCCSHGGYERIFGASTAKRDLRRYRRRGLARDARAAVDFLRRVGVKDAAVLEAGGGVGAVQVELLDAGAAHTVNVELSREYEESARDLLREHGLEDRVERRFGDFTALDTGDADAVVMCRVVCCYPDYERLVGTAADRARRALVFTHPPDGRLSDAVVFVGNLLLRLARQEFRMYAHPVPAMREVAEAHGLRHVGTVRRPIWSVECFERFPADNTGNGRPVSERERTTHHPEPEPDPEERAEEATEESRRERGDMPIEEQEGLGAGREDDEKPRPF